MHDRREGWAQVNGHSGLIIQKALAWVAMTMISMFILTAIGVAGWAVVNIHAIDNRVSNNEEAIKTAKEIATEKLKLRDQKMDTLNSLIVANGRQIEILTAHISSLQRSVSGLVSSLDAHRAGNGKD